MNSVTWLPTASARTTLTKPPVNTESGVRMHANQTYISVYGRFGSVQFAIVQYQVGFLQNDAAEMKRQVAWAADKPGWDDVLLASEANTAPYSRPLGKARG